MLRKFALLLLAIQSPWVTPCALGSPASDDLNAKLAKRVTNYDLSASNLVGALIRVSSDFRIPMGIVWVNTPEARVQKAFAWKDATVLQIINDIVKTQPGYQVEVRNGLVHTFSPASVSDPQNFLKLRIETFEAHNEVEVASWKLHMLVTPRKYGQISIGATGDS